MVLSQYRTPTRVCVVGRVRPPGSGIDLHPARMVVLLQGLTEADCPVRNLFDL